MNSPFTIRKANEWLDLAAKTPASESLYADLWHEGETVCLMDRDRSGKTALALEIASKVSLSRDVLFIDFASTARGFASRNSSSFPDRLRRLEVSRDSLDDLGPEALMDRLEEEVRDSGIKVCVLDSLTWLCDRFRKSDAARWFMQRLAKMKRALGLSILIVANPARRIEPFIDSSFSCADAEPAPKPEAPEIPAKEQKKPEQAPARPGRKSDFAYRLSHPSRITRSIQENRSSRL